MQAMLQNGNTDITGIQVQGNFKGENGQRAGSGMAKVDVVSGSNMTAQDLSITPIKPNQTVPIRIRFEHYPANWNKQAPELVVTQVTGAKPWIRARGRDCNPNSARRSAFYGAMHYESYDSGRSLLDAQRLAKRLSM